MVPEAAVLQPEAPLHMIQLYLDLPRVVAAIPRFRAGADDDLGYSVHCQLRALFRELAPQPFRALEDHRRWLQVIGYSTADASALAQAATMFASPALHRAVDWDRLASKPLPVSWPLGRRFGFETRVCPSVRRSSGGPQARAGAEVDAFLAECWKVGDPARAVDRESVYRSWLERAFDGSGVQLNRADLVAFRQCRVLRRTQGQDRRAQTSGRPDALLRGDLSIVDSSAFSRFLARGVGRHRAFGFGLLLLRPAPWAAC